MFKTKKNISTKFRLFYHSLIKNCMFLLIPLLVICPYSIYRSVKDNTIAIEKNMTLVLEQFDIFFETLFSHIDNANIFFSSNPRVTLQMGQAFREPALTLESIRNISNISLNFQNILHTNSYMENIYIYYKNPNQRIFMPQISAMQKLSHENEEKLLEMMKNEKNKDTWFLTHTTFMSNGNMSNQRLYVMRKLYTRSTASNNGLLIFSCNTKDISRQFNDLMQYPSQTYYLFDSEGSLIYSSASSSSLVEDVTNHLPLVPQTNTPKVNTVKLGDKNYLLASLSSNRQDGLTYISLTPSNEIYGTANRLTIVYFVLTCISMVIAFFLAFLKTKREYRYLNHMIDLFANPSQVLDESKKVKKYTKNPFEYIIQNITHIFIEQDYLKIQASEKESKMKLLKTQMLQNQINPHFMHNTLNAVYWESVRMTSSENDCSIMIHNLSALMRYSFDTPKDEVKIKDEFEYVKLYINIMQIRFPNQLQVYYQIDEISSDLYTKKMILQPLVENAIYHGVKGKNDITTICIGAKILKKHVALYVYDNGKGIPSNTLRQLQEKMNEEKILTSNNVGLTNTNLRLTYAYGHSSRLRIKSKEGCYTGVYFFIPITEVQDK